MRKLVVTISFLIPIHLSAVAAEIIIVDDFSDGLFEETLAPGEGLNQLQTGLSGVLGGERQVFAGDIRAIPGPGTVTVGVLERDGGIGVVNSEVFVEGLDFTYENFQLDLTKAGFSALNVDLNVISLPEGEQPGGVPRPLVLGPVLRSQQGQQRPSYLSGTILTYEVGQQTLSLEFDEFVNDRGFDESDVDRVFLSVRTSSGLNVEIDRIYFVPEPASFLSIVIGIIPFFGRMRHRA